MNISLKYEIQEVRRIEISPNTFDFFPYKIKSIYLLFAGFQKMILTLEPEQAKEELEFLFVFREEMKKNPILGDAELTEIFEKLKTVIAENIYVLECVVEETILEDDTLEDLILDYYDGLEYQKRKNEETYTFQEIKDHLKIV
jgi:hypothetical protein